MNLEPLHRLSSHLLEALASSLRSGALSAGLTSSPLRQIAGGDHAALLAALQHLERQGLTPPQMALLVDAIRSERDRSPPPSTLFDLVLTGPEVEGVPTVDTAARMSTLVQGATREIILVGYAIHNGRRLFEPLHRRSQELPSLRILFCLNIPRDLGSSETNADILRRFAREFRSRHWPWDRAPEVFYDRRALETYPEERASLHAKCVIVDRRSALVTSANFTEAAHHRNIEAGVLIHHAPFAERLADYFQSLMRDGRLTRCELPTVG